ncbi:3-oxo-5-alpha-steroid 4-dehydrogenase 2-like [Eriocheir sinensis]|uniref:3-oxo-5-alpha-steroid 4-dehydrogenase 2-like n=1 Tax=Eriocheir sinensis TaxID=95602 RepID=UPI0021CA2378|nr:3-oxo-5-alpha-steroid 4-dehydrogenase 2-like [Eriocheir sinensis]
MKFSPEVLNRAYIYPLFMAKNESELITAMCWGFPVLVLASLLLKDSENRSSSISSRLRLPGTLASFLQEVPAFLLPVLLVAYGRQRSYKGVVNQLCLGMFVMHFFQRCFISPFLMTKHRPVPLLPFLLAFLTHAYIGLLHGLYFVNHYHYKDEVWLFKPNFCIGFLIFLYGMKTNIGADSALRKVQRGRVPTGGWFEKISCPHYFGEILEMWGYALASLAPPALLLALGTTLLLGLRALHLHQWYLKKFEDYPKTRKAVIPFLL